MKRFMLFLFSAVFALLMATPALACSYPSDPACAVQLEINAGAYQGVMDESYLVKEKYGTSGEYLSEGFGQSGLSSHGDPFSAEVNALGGALGSSNSYTFSWEDGKGVGTKTQADAMSGADLSVTPGSEGHFQGSLSGGINLFTGADSWYGGTSENPETFGFSGQAVTGEFSGEVNKTNHGGYEMSAYINAQAKNVSESYGYKVYGDGWQVKGAGSNVESYTSLQSGSTGPVSGGWEVEGIAATGTLQTYGDGYAGAGAIGTYSCSGSLGQNFSGYAVGGTNTSITTVDGKNGSINKAQAYMSVGSNLE